MNTPLLLELSRRKQDVTLISKCNILFIKVSNSSFIENDEKILTQHCHTLWTFNYSESHHITSQIRLFYFLLSKIFASHLIYIWFASYHSVLPVIFSRLVNKKCVIIIGGHDAARVPELHYGVHRKRIRSICNKLSCKLTERLYAVSKFTYRNLLSHIGNNQAGKTSVIYNGVDTEYFKPIPQIQRKNHVVTVCGTKKMNILRLKGVDYYIELARSRPQTVFTIVGLQGRALKWCLQRKPGNLNLLEPLEPARLKDIMNKTKVICQFSRYEAFGLALAEGMSMGCIPVGYNFGGTQEIIGNVGYLIENMTIEAGNQAITAAIGNELSNTEAIRDRIINCFSLTRRRQIVLEQLNLLLGEV